MSANLVHTEAFIREEQKLNIIRTDFITENALLYLLENYYSFYAIRPVNKKEEDTFNKFKNVLISFRNKIDPLKNICEAIFNNGITESTVNCYLLGVANELFSEGITWSRIVGYFIFAGELAIICIKFQVSKSIVNAICKSFSMIVKEKLETWIEDHDGWEGILSLEVAERSDLTKQSWTKVILNVIIRVVGVSRHILNSIL